MISQAYPNSWQGEDPRRTSKKEGIRSQLRGTALGGSTKPTVDQVVQIPDSRFSIPTFGQTLSWKPGPYPQSRVHGNCGGMAWANPILTKP